MTIVKSPRGKGQWLKAEVVRGKLVISIGVDTLAFAAQHVFDSKAMDDSEGQQERSEFFVAHPELFAKDVLHELLDEEENGDTGISKLLDWAMERALDYGSLGVGERETEAPTQITEEKP